MRGMRQVLRQLLGPQGAHADARRPPVQVRLLREAPQEQDLPGGTREAAHGREALPLLHLCGWICVQQWAWAAYARCPQDRGQGRHDGVESEGKAKIIIKRRIS